MTPSSTNKRRATRKRASISATITDVITGHVFGHLGNLSSTGMLVISASAPHSEAIYQVRFSLPYTGPLAAPSAPIEVGIQEQWQEAAASTGQIWAGYRIVAISDDDAAKLEHWLSQS